MSATYYMLLYATGKLRYACHFFYLGDNGEH